MQPGYRLAGTTARLVSVVWRIAAEQESEHRAAQLPGQLRAPTPPLDHHLRASVSRNNAGAPVRVRQPIILCSQSRLQALNLFACRCVNGRRSQTHAGEAATAHRQLVVRHVPHALQQIRTLGSHLALHVVHARTVQHLHLRPPSPPLGACQPVRQPGAGPCALRDASAAQSCNETMRLYEFANNGNDPVIHSSTSPTQQQYYCDMRHDSTVQVVPGCAPAAGASAPLPHPAAATPLSCCACRGSLSPAGPGLPRCAASAPPHAAPAHHQPAGPLPAALHRPSQRPRSRA